MGSTGASALGRQNPATSGGVEGGKGSPVAAAATAALRLFRRSFSWAVATASLTGLTYIGWSSLGIAPDSASRAFQRDWQREGGGEESSAWRHT